MTYTVVWLPDADKELLRLWLDSSARETVTVAAHDVDRILRVDPNEQGESRDSQRRVLIVRPLAVTFSVSDADRVVTVFDVWLCSE